MVPRRGLEPPRLAALVPETSASTNSAIWADSKPGVIQGEWGGFKGLAGALAYSRPFSLTGPAASRRPKAIWPAGPVISYVSPGFTSAGTGTHRVEEPGVRHSFPSGSIFQAPAPSRPSLVLNAMAPSSPST
jgi:hypothetical protein